MINGSSLGIAASVSPLRAFGALATIGGGARMVSPFAPCLVLDGLVSVVHVHPGVCENTTVDEVLR
jgi:hypothetical protein